MPNIGNITGKRAALRYHGRWHDVTLDEHGYLTAYIPERDTNVQPERPAPPPCQGCGTSVKNGQDNLFGACRRNAMGWAPTSFRAAPPKPHARKRTNASISYARTFEIAGTGTGTEVDRDTPPSHQAGNPTGAKIGQFPPLAHEDRHSRVPEFPTYQATA